MIENVVRCSRLRMAPSMSVMSCMWHQWASHSPSRLWHDGRITQRRVADGLQALVEVVDQGDARGDVEPDHCLIGHGVEIFHQRPQAIPMRHNEHTRAALQGGDNRRLPIRQEARHGVLEGFGTGGDPEDRAQHSADPSLDSADRHT